MEKETKEDRFIRVAERRVESILHGIRSLSQCANRKVYAWDDKQLKKIWDAVEHELAECKQSFGDPTARSFRL